MLYRLTALILLLSCCMNAYALERTGLQAALEKGLVTVQAVSTADGYNGKGLQLKVRNTTKQPLQVTLDPALIFRPADTSYQDLVVASEQVLTLAANRETIVALQTFCAKSYARAPNEDLSYRFWRQGDSALIKVVRYIVQHKIDGTLGQSAVWVITNDHELDGVFDPAQPEVSNKLLALLVQLTGKRVPAYFTQYELNTTGGEPAFLARALKLYAAFDWKLESPRVLDLGIYNEQGDLVQAVFPKKVMARGGYKIQVTFEAENVPKGNYHIRLKDGETVMKEQTVRVE